MKKLIVLALAVVIAACVGVTAFADVATPFDTASLKIDMLEDFSDTDNITGTFLGVPNASATIDEAIATGSYAVDGNFTVVNGNQAWVGVLDSAFAGAESAEGLGFYVKNANDADSQLSFYAVADATANLNGLAFTIGSNKDYALIDSNGKTVVTAPEAEHPHIPGTMVQSAFVIPAGFEGYVCVPYASLQKNWDTAMYNNEALVGFGVMGGVGLVFDNIFVYGANVTADTDASDLLGEGGTDSADVSVIAYAVAAITGLGALVVAKKR